MRPSGLFLQSLRGTHTHTRVIAHLQVYTHTPSMLAVQCQDAPLLMHREEEEDTREEATRRRQGDVSQATCERGGGETDVEGGRGVEGEGENMTNGRI